MFANLRTLFSFTCLNLLNLHVYKLKTDLADLTDLTDF